MAKQKRKAAEISIDINANVAQLAKDMKKVAGELDGLGRKVSSIQKLVAASFTFDVLKTAIPYIKDMAGALGDLAARGEKFGSIADSFEKLGGSSSQIEQAKKAVLGVVDSFTLMQIANEGLVKQIPGFADNFGKIADLGNRVADALGIEAADGIRQVTDALATAKDKQLAAVGITINAEAAYKNYAAAIGLTASQLSDAQKLEARQIASLEALDGALNRLSPSADSVANAMDAVKVALNEGLNQVGIAINSNDELMKAYRELADVLDDIDWATLGTAAAQFFTTVLSAASAALPVIIKWIEDANRGFQYLFGDGIQAQADRSATKIADLKKEMEGLNQPFSGGTLINVWDKDYLGPTQKKRKEELKKEIEAEQANFEKLKVQLAEQAAKTTDAANATGNMTIKIEGLNQTIIPAIKNTQQSTQAIDEQAKAAAKAAKEVDKINSSWSRYVEAANKANQENIDFGSISDSDFEALKQQMQDIVRGSFYEEWKEKINLGGQHYEEVLKAADYEVFKAGRDLDKKRSDAKAERDRKNAAETERQLNQMYGQMTDIGNELGVDLGGVFDQLSQNFGSQMTDLMNTIGKSLGMTGAEFAGYMNVVVEGIGNALRAKSIDKENKSNKGTGGAIGYSAGASIGAYFGGPAGAQLGGEIGKVVGEAIGDQFKWGPQNKETRARHVFANWLEDQLSQLQAVTLMDANGKFVSARGNLMNFVEGDTGRFNKPGWADEMQGWGDTARGMFDGLGNALKGLLGITEDVGGQMAYLLGQNLAGNIDNARLLVYQLGLSFEDLSEALLKMAKNGEITWQEYAANVAGVAEAFKPGLSALNDMTGAVNQLIGSGGRGMAALKGVKDIVIEAMEGGARSLEDLRGQLVKGGMNPEDAEKFVQALKAAGVRTLEEVKNMSEAQLGQIVASVGNSVSSINDKWKEIGTTLEKIKWDMDKLPTEKDIKVNFTASFDDNMNKARDAGLLDPNGNSSFGEVAPPNTSNTRVSGTQSKMAARSLNTGGGTFKAQAFNINIDARNAEAGVEEKIFQVVRSYGDVIAQQAANIVRDEVARGG